MKQYLKRVDVNFQLKALLGLPNSFNLVCQNGTVMYDPHESLKTSNQNAILTT